MDHPSEAILIINAGSSSIKFSLFNSAVTGGMSADKLICSGQIAGLGVLPRFEAQQGSVSTQSALTEKTTHAEGIAFILDWLQQHQADQTIVAAGHRIVHGGVRHWEPIVIDENVMAELRRLIPLAPLHQPHNIAAVDVVGQRYPQLPQIACFDTAFHHTNPLKATTFAIPRSLTEEGVRRYGFHGLSYEYINSVMPQYLGTELAAGRVVVAHLGAGASMCAMYQGKSIASTMGFTVLDGLMMNRRCGTIDPGVLLYLLQEKEMDASTVAKLLYNDSGLKGVSGISEDMKILLASNEPNAAEAIDLYIYRIGRELGSLVAAMGGLDALIVTAGIGEHAAVIRRKIAESASWLGVQIDTRMNAAATNTEPVCLSPQGAKVPFWMIPTDEDLMIAQHTQRLLLK